MNRRLRNLLITTIAILAYLLVVWSLYKIEKGHNDFREQYAIEHKINEDELKSPKANIETLGDAVWYSVITLTTIGYGDKFPVTDAGRFLALIFVLGSIGILGYFISEMSNKFYEYMEDKKLGYLGTDFENHVVIIHWNEFAQEIVQEIVNAGKQVVVITQERDNIEIIYNNYDRELVFALHYDYMDQKTFERANIQSAKTLLLNFEEDTDNLVNLIALKKVFPHLSYVIALNSPSLKETFHELGVTFTLSKNEVASKLIASFVFEPVVAQITEGLMSSATTDEDMGLMQFRIIEENPFVNAKCFDLFIQLKKDLNVILVGLSKKNGKLINNPTNQHTVEVGDYLAVLGCPKARMELTSLFQVEEGI